MKKVGNRKQPSAKKDSVNSVSSWDLSSGLTKTVDDELDDVKDEDDEEDLPEAQVPAAPLRRKMWSSAVPCGFGGRSEPSRLVRASGAPVCESLRPYMAPGSAVG